MSALEKMATIKRAMAMVKQEFEECVLEGSNRKERKMDAKERTNCYAMLIGIVELQNEAIQLLTMVVGATSIGPLDVEKPPGLLGVIEMNLWNFSRRMQLLVKMLKICGTVWVRKPRTPFTGRNPWRMRSYQN